MYVHNPKKKRVALSSTLNFRFSTVRFPQSLSRDLDAIDEVAFGPEIELLRVWVTSVVN